MGTRQSIELMALLDQPRLAEKTYSLTGQAGRGGVRKSIVEAQQCCRHRREACRHILLTFMNPRRYARYSSLAVDAFCNACDCVVGHKAHRFVEVATGPHRDKR